MGDLAALLAGGGPVVWGLAALSVASLTLIGWKWLQLLPVLGRADRREAALRAWRGGDAQGAFAALEGARAPADRLLRMALEGLAAGDSPASLEQELTWRGNAEIASMSRMLRLLELIAMISPLLGLLGTVLGMIRSFRDLSLAEGAANASILADGIWQALLTTAAGLIVAIPAAVAASLLAGRVDRAAATIETAVGRALALGRPDAT